MDKRRFVVGQSSTQELAILKAKRSPNFGIPVQFLRGITVQELAPGSTGRFEIKESLKFDANMLTGAEFFTKTGTGQSTIYTFDIDLMTVKMDRLIGAKDPLTLTASNASGDLLLTSASHGLSVGNKVQFSNTTDDSNLPGNLLPNTDYFVITSGLTANAFKVSLTLAGSAIAWSSAGSGTNQFRRIDDDQTSVLLMAAMQFTENGRTEESQNLVFEYQNDICRDADTTPTATPEDVILNIRAGKPAITNGVDAQHFTFASPFTSGASVAIVGNVAKPTTGGDNIFGVVRDDTVDETGFDVDFSNTIPASGYKFHYQAVQL